MRAKPTGKRKAQIDWAGLKQEYFESNFITLKDFLRSKNELKDYSEGSLEQLTRKWATEKREFLKARAEKAQQIAEKNFEKYQQSLQVAKRNMMRKIARLVGGNEEVAMEDLAKLKVAWEMIKVEVGEPTAVAKTEQKINMLVEGLGDDAKKKLNEILGH